MRFTAARSLGEMDVYDLSLDHDHHSFAHKSQIILHNCAYLIANRPVHEFVPLTTISDVKCTSYTAPSVEAVGGLKMDFLVIKGLNDIAHAIKLIQHRSGIEIPKETAIGGKRVPGHRILPFQGQIYDIYKLPNDQAVFNDIAAGKTETVWQLNTPSARGWLSHFNHNGQVLIKSIFDIAVFTALDRPGPLDYFVSNPDEPGKKHNALVEYTRRARGETDSPDIMPLMRELVPETFGILVFQESLQRVYQQLTGCTGPEAEEFRSNVAKKKKAKVDKAYTFFTERAAEKIGPENAKQVWMSLISWAKYGFGLSHSASYSYLAYICAFLKHHYPLEWWTSVLKFASKNEVAEKFWAFCGHMIDLPDVVKSGPFWEIQNERIRAPLSLLQGMGDKAHEELSAVLPATDVQDLMQKIDARRVSLGTKVTKTVKKLVIDAHTGKRKRQFNAETNKNEYVYAQIEEESVAKARTSLNRKVMYTLILSGAMDGLYSPETTVTDKLQQYELALATTLAAPGKDPKPEAVDPQYTAVSALRLYQIRKAILPIYGLNLVPVLVQKGALTSTKYQDKDRVVYSWYNDYRRNWETLRVATWDELEILNHAPVVPKQPTQIAVVAYVDDVTVRVWGDESKEMCKLILDVEGAPHEFVKWSNKKTGLVPKEFKALKKGDIGVFVLSKYRDDKPFSVEAVEVVEKAIDHTEPEPPKEEPSPETPEEVML